MNVKELVKNFNKNPPPISKPFQKPSAPLHSLNLNEQLEGVNRKRAVNEYDTASAPIQRETLQINNAKKVWEDLAKQRQLSANPTSLEKNKPNNNIATSNQPAIHFLKHKQAPQSPAVPNPFDVNESMNSEVLFPEGANKQCLDQRESDNRPFLMHKLSDQGSNLHTQAGYLSNRLTLSQDHAEDMVSSVISKILGQQLDQEYHPKPRQVPDYQKQASPQVLQRANSMMQMLFGPNYYGSKDSQYQTKKIPVVVIRALQPILGYRIPKSIASLPLSDVVAVKSKKMSRFFFSSI